MSAIIRRIDDLLTLLSATAGLLSATGRSRTPACAGRAFSGAGRAPDGVAPILLLFDVDGTLTVPRNVALS